MGFRVGTDETDGTDGWGCRGAGWGPLPGLGGGIFVFHVGEAGIY